MSGRYSLKIPGLGVLDGRDDGDGVAQFTNVPYGTVTQRFAEALLASSNDEARIDCTTQGPLCPHHAPFDDDWNGVPKCQCKPIELRFDERRGLNMIVTLPTSFQKPLPVLVWVHGGGNIAGTCYRGSSDPSRLVKRSIAQGRPIIVLTPNYRTGILGFMPFDGIGNWGVKDLILVLRWLKTYGHSLGADLARVTLAGQSSGAVNAYAVSVDPEASALVGQIACLSGPVGNQRAFVSTNWYENLQKRVLELLGMASPDDLRTVDWRKVVQLEQELGIKSLLPIREARYAEYPLVSRLILQDAAEDGNFFVDTSNEAAELFRTEAPASIQEALSPAAFYTAYVFGAGIERLISSSHSDTSIYRIMFDAINPFDPTLGNNHMVELHYVLNYYRTQHQYDEVVAYVQSTWIDHVNFGNPWDPDTEALYVPREGMPRVVSHAEAKKLRDAKTLELVADCVLPKINDWLRGWPPTRGTLVH